MKHYPKINSIFKRDPNNNYKTFLFEEYSTSEIGYLAHNTWVGTEKLDGTSIVVHWDGENIKYGGHTPRSQIYSPLLTSLHKQFEPVYKLFKKLFSEDDVYFYLEGVGNKVQKGSGNYTSGVDPFGYRDPLDKYDGVMFDIRIGNWWLKREDIESIGKEFRIAVAPIVFKGTLWEAVNKTSHGFESFWGAFSAEGMVLRPKVELKARNGSRIITKVKYRDFIK